MNTIFANTAHQIHLIECTIETLESKLNKLDHKRSLELITDSDYLKGETFFMNQIDELKFEIETLTTL